VTTTSINLQAGSQYILKATGTGYIASGRRGDADFMQGTTTQVNWQDNANLNTSADIGLGMGYGSSAAKVVWTTDGTGGQVHQYDAPTSQDAGHAYEYAFTAASDGNLALKFFDLPGMYGDNSGSLSVTVYQEVVRGVSARATSGTGALVTWQNDADAAEYVVSQSTDGVNFTVAGYANAGDTGMLVTNLTPSTHYTFRVTSYTDDGAVAVGTAAAVWTNSSSAAGVYQVQSPDGAYLHRDETSALITSQSLSIVNSYVVAGSAEEAVLMSLSGSATVNGRTYTPLSGAFKYVDHYTPTRSGAWGAAGHDIGPVLEFEDMWQAGGTYDFNDDFVRIGATWVKNFSVSVQATCSIASRDSGTPAIFTLSRTGDINSAGTVHFNMSQSAAADDYTLTLADGTSLTPISGVYSFIFSPYQTEGYVYLKAGATSTATYNPTLTLIDSYAGAAATFGSSVTDSQPICSPFNSDMASIFRDPSAYGFTTSRIVKNWVDSVDSDATSSDDPGSILLNDSGTTYIKFGRHDINTDMKYQVFNMSVSPSTALITAGLGAAGATFGLTSFANNSLIKVVTWIDSNGNGIIDSIESSTVISSWFSAYVAAPPAGDSFQKSSDKTIGDITTGVIKEMEDDRWTPPPTSTGTPNPGAFGSAVHEKVSAKLPADGWMTNVFVDNETKKIVAIGGSAGIDPTGATEIDALALKPGYQPGVGDVLDKTKIRVYDIKATLKGAASMSPDQRLRLSAIAGEENVQVVTVPKVLKSDGEWIVNTRYKAIFFVLAMAKKTDEAWAVVHPAQFDAELSAVADKIQLAKAYSRTKKDDPTLIMGAQMDAEVALKNYLAHFMSGDALDMVFSAAVYKTWMDALEKM